MTHRAGSPAEGNVYRDRIRDRLAMSIARPLEPTRALWELDDGPWWRAFTKHRNRVAEIKSALIEAAWELPQPLFLSPPEDPAESELGSFLLERDDNTWEVDRRHLPRDFYTGELWWGNWFLYSAAQPWTGDIPNTFKTTPQELLGFMSRAGIVFFVDSFYDDTAWRVGVSPDPPSSSSS